TGNEVRYRVQEQLMGFDLPNEAIGRTAAVSGTLALDAGGKVVEDQSKFTIQVGGLTSDRDRRDGYVRGRLLETEQYPTVVFVPTAIQGWSGALPASGSRAITVTGNLTIKGVTHPTTWRANASFEKGQVSGTASTGFTFEDFSLAKPRVPVVLSVADSIHLEYDFRMALADSASARQAN
ncbi:MAG: YceI family protein, partial [Gemmatimonadota bacterium]